VVTSIDVIGDPQPWKAGWRVRAGGDRPKIVDVFVQGASAGMHFRNRFQDWLGKAGVDGMIEKLRSLTKDSPNLALVSAN
jgi:ABC-type transporter MlaC component